MSPEEVLRTEYEKYLAGYHGMSPPLEFHNWATQSRIPLEIKLDPITSEKQPQSTQNPKDLLGILKLPLRFIPPSSLAFLAQVMELGASKYGPMNWRKNDVRALVYYEAALRHIWSAMDGEDIDPESNQLHAAHAMACMAIILDAKATGNLIDDRFDPGAFGSLVQSVIKNKKAEL